jgi:hypothetical protein
MTSVPTGIAPRPGLDTEGSYEFAYWAYTMPIIVILSILIAYISLVSINKKKARK